MFDQNIKVKPAEEGYYLIVHEQGKGATIDSGKIVTLEYEGRFTDGKILMERKQAVDHTHL